MDTVVMGGSDMTELPAVDVEAFLVLGEVDDKIRRAIFYPRDQSWRQWLENRRRALPSAWRGLRSADCAMFTKSASTIAGLGSPSGPVSKQSDRSDARAPGWVR